jgi:hypothetical protein
MGNTMVVVSSEDFHNKTKSALSEMVHMKLTTDPTSKRDRTLSPIKKSDTPDDIKRRSICHASVPPRLYDVLEIHKK